MENYNLNYETLETKTLSGSKTFLANVFLYMSIALLLTASIAAYFGAESNRDILISALTSQAGGLNILGYAVMFAPLLFVLTMSFAFNRLSFPLLIIFFMAYAAINGLSLSFIFLKYTNTSIYTTFLSAAALFGVMAVVGYTTSTDLTSFGRIMLIGLIGIIIASLINFFLQSGTMQYIISTVGVLVFTGLTVYDVQKLKMIGSGVMYDEKSKSKLAVMGALNLYLDFINIFLFLLQLFGDRRD